MKNILNFDDTEELKRLQRKVHHHDGHDFVRIETEWGLVTFQSNNKEEFLNSILKKEPKYAPNLSKIISKTT